MICTPQESFIYRQTEPLVCPDGVWLVDTVEHALYSQLEGFKLIQSSGRISSKTGSEFRECLKQMISIRRCWDEHLQITSLSAASLNPHRDQFSLHQSHSSSPDALLVGLIVGSDVVHVALGDDGEVNVAAGAQVVEDASSDGVPDQPLGLLLLAADNTVRSRASNSHVTWRSARLTSMSGLKRSSKTAMAAREPDPEEKKSGVMMGRRRG